MASVAVLSHTQLAVLPGEGTTLHVTVRNTGTVVDEFSIEPLGDAAGWITMEPAVLPLYPGAEGVFTVDVRAPRAAATAPGPLAFGLLVRSSQDPEGSVVEEGVIDVGRFSDVAVELLPRTSRARGRRAGRHELAIDNRGNTPMTCTFSTLDDDGKAAVEVSALSVQVPPGEAAFVPVKVRSTKAFWRGPAVSHPFQVYVEPGNDPHIAVDGTLLQESILPRWFFKALAALVALLVLLTALWLLVLKPTIEDTASEAAVKAAEAKAAEVATAEAQKAAAAAAGPLAAEQQAQQAQIEALAEQIGVPVPPGTGSGDPLGEPTAVRLGPKPGTLVYTVPPDSVFSLTDVLFQNPNGDSGEITLRRGSSILFVERLDNFRDLDQHFVAPVTVNGGDKLIIDITCEAPGMSKGKCTPGVLLSGFLRATPPAA